MADNEHRPFPSLHDVCDSFSATLLKLRVADSEHFIDNQDIRLDVHGYRESKSHPHAGRQVFDRGIDEIANSRKLDD